VTESLGGDPAGVGLRAVLAEVTDEERESWSRGHLIPSRGLRRDCVGFGPGDDLRGTADRLAIGELEDRELLLTAELLELWSRALREQAERLVLAEDSARMGDAGGLEGLVSSTTRVDLRPAGVDAAYVEFWLRGDRGPPWSRFSPA